MERDEITTTHLASGQQDNLALHQDDLKEKDLSDGAYVYALDEEKHSDVYQAKSEALAGAAQDGLQMTEEEFRETEEKLESMSLERAYHIIAQAREMHKYDQNFPGSALAHMAYFLDNPDVMAHPQEHSVLIREMKLEAILSTENSPYQEVRANVDPTDDPTMPSLTFRVMVIGTIFGGIGSFVDTLFLVRLPAISISSNVAQIVAYPAGRFLAWALPDKWLNLFGRKISLNPGPFSRKEHMLITIMAQVSFTYPYTAFLIPTQALPVYFGQPYAREFGYQLLATLGINMCGYGLAGLTRRFLVYPSVCLWPGSLVTVALNKAFHTDRNEPVKGPFGWVYRRSREQVLLLSFAAMFCYYFFPGFIWTGLSTFNWISWIAPNNTTLNNLVGSNYGLGINPWPTFDWNNLTAQFTPLTIPTFAVLSQFIGVFINAFLVIGLYWTNAWNTSYLGINDNHIFDNTGARFKVAKVTNAEGSFDNDAYQAYSQPWVSAGYLAQMFMYFALYAATLTYVILYHRNDLFISGRAAWRSMRKSLFKKYRNEHEDEDDLAEDVHYRLAKQYPEAPEWWYLIVLVIAAVCGMVAVGAWPTHTSPVVVVYGIIMPLIAMIPCGLIQSVTGIPVPLQVLAQFIGGAFSGGNGIALMYFKSFGYISMYQALAFSNDLKLGHYLKIPPRHTFIVQVWATLVNTFISAALLNFQMSFKNICTPQAAFKFVCPGQSTFFTGAVFWGTLGPDHLFGPGRRYNLLLLGFPVGVAIVFIHYALKRTLPKREWVRQIHPVMIFAGAATFGAPYNLSYIWPVVMVTVLSFQYIRKKYPEFWIKFNYVIAAAFPAGIAVSAVVIFFALEIPKGGLSIDWWGNSVSYNGCEGEACTRLPIPDIGYFGPAPGTNSFT